jgi:hypothetical protein
VGVATANFFFSEGAMSIVTGDDEGVLRIYEYSPDGRLLGLSAIDLSSHHCLQVPSQKMVNTCCAALNFTGNARASRLASSLGVLKTTLSSRRLN